MINLKKVIDNNQNGIDIYCMDRPNQIFLFHLQDKSLAPAFASARLLLSTRASVMKSLFCMFVIGAVAVTVRNPDLVKAQGYLLIEKARSELVAHNIEMGSFQQMLDQSLKR
jgi:hypothetical protein